jgi:hypothetical protein
VYWEEEPLLSKNGLLQGLLVRCESWSLRAGGAGAKTKDRNMAFSEEARNILDYYVLQVPLPCLLPPPFGTRLLALSWSIRAQKIGEPELFLPKI